MALLPAAAGATTLYDFTLNDIDGKPVDLRSYAGKVVLVVNTASRCGFTPQFEGLEKLHQSYRDQGLVVLGFPSNDFMGQDPGSDAEIKSFCTKEYGVSFPMFSKVAVAGKNAAPLYLWLTDKKIHPKTGGAVSWNFNKFLIGRDGTVIGRFDSTVAPENPGFRKALEAALRG
jgi:glutathione peroxidase